MSQLVTKHPIELEPATWSHFPHDLILNTIEYSDALDLLNWSCVSRAVSIFATSRLWRRLRKSSQDLEAFMGSHEPCVNKDIISFLFDRPSRTFALTFPQSTSYVQELVIEQNGCRDGRKRQTILDAVLPELLERFPRLVGCHFKGAILKSTYAFILQTDQLTSLAIRVCSDEPESMVSTRRFPSAPVFFDTVSLEEVTLNFRLLASLKNLKTLRIDALRANEVEGLVESVVSLDLDCLVLDCWPHRWVQSFNFTRNFGLREPSTSPLVIFFDNLVIPSKQGLPQTLRKLIISDYDSHRTPPLHQKIAKAVARCASLETLRVNFLVEQDQFENSGGKFFCANPNRLAIHSWDKLISEEETDFEFRYLGYGREKPSTNILADTQNILQVSIGAILDNMTPKADNVLHFVGNVEFVRVSSVPYNIVMVIPRECKHMAYPSLCFQCSKSYLTIGDAVMGVSQFNFPFVLLSHHLEAFSIDRGKGWLCFPLSFRAKRDWKDRGKIGSWAVQLHDVINKYSPSETENRCRIYKDLGVPLWA